MNNLRKYALGLAAIILLFAAGSSDALFEIAHGANSATKAILPKSLSPGIRLATPLDRCSTDCRSQQVGCGNLTLNVCIPHCALPVTSTAIASGGSAPYLFTVTDPNGMPVSISSPIENPPGVFGVTFTAITVGAYTTTVTDAKGCRVTCIQRPRLAVFVTAVTSLCIPAVLNATVFEGTPPYSFSVIDPSGAPVAVSPAGFDGVTFIASKAGSYVVTANDASGCSGQGFGAGVPCMALTQAEWGKNKPKFNGQKRAKTIQRLFQNELNGKELVVGVAGERSITFTQDSASCIMERLPASGAPTSLPAGFGDAQINSDTCQTAVPIPLLDNKFQNALLGQTIALTLNTGGVLDDGGLTLDSGSFPALWHLVLCGNMVTQGVLPGGDGIFGTDDDVLDPNSSKLTVTIPTPVLNAIEAGSTLDALGKFTFNVGNRSVTVAPGTVGRLLILANLALAGEPNLGGATIADINTAMDAVNRAFDGCRFLVVGCSSPGQSNLQINFNPNPVPQDTQNRCGGSFPSWIISTTLTETSGVGLTINKFTTNAYDNGGNLLVSNSVDGNTFATFFQNCGARSSHIAAFGQACGLICQSLGGLSTGSLIYKFEGTDDNGHPVSLTSDRLVLRGSGTSANLAITFNPNPVSKSTQPCAGNSPSWHYTATLTETAGIGINISKFTWDFYDSTGNLLSTQTNGSSDFSSFFSACGPGSTRIAPNGRACGNLCSFFGGTITGGAVVMTFYGTDDRGNQVLFASSRLKLLE